MRIQEALRGAWAKLSGQPEEKPVAITPEAIISRFKVGGKDREDVQRVNLKSPDVRQTLPTSPYYQLFRTMIEIYNSGLVIEPGSSVEANLVLYERGEPVRAVPLNYKENRIDDIIKLCLPSRLPGVFTQERAAEILAEIKSREGMGRMGRMGRKVIFEGIKVSSTLARDKY